MKIQNVIAAIILAMLVVLGIVAVCLATPFLISNAQTGATSYDLTGPSWLPTSVATTTGALRVDLGTIAVPGTYAVTAKACKNDPTWGKTCGATGNFTLTCPSPTTFTAPVLTVVP